MRSAEMLSASAPTRLLCSLTLQVSELYGAKLDEPTKEAQTRSNAAGMGFGFAQLCMFGEALRALCHALRTPVGPLRFAGC